MTSQSPPAGDDELFRLASLIGCEPEDEERHRKELSAYILSEIQKAKPEKDTITDDMVASTIAWHEGYNEGLDDYEQALTAKFGGKKDEQI